MRMKTLYTFLIMITPSILLAAFAIIYQMLHYRDVLPTAGTFATIDLILTVTFALLVLLLKMVLTFINARRHRGGQS